MIKFDDVRRTNELTFVPIPNSHVDELEHFLSQVGFQPSEYEILSEDEMRARHPEIQVTPVPFDRRFPKALCQHPCVVVSRMNATDLARKLDEIRDSEDAETWREQQSQIIEAEMEDELRAIQAENAALDGWGSGLTRESEDAR